MEKSFFFNAKKSGETYDRVYQAEDFASYFAEFIGNGIFPNPSTGLQVVESANHDMTTTLKPGAAFINGYGYKNTGDIVFTHKVADGSLNRKDAIFIRFDNAGRAIGAIKMEGSVGAEAVAPKPIRTADYYDLCVAIINVNAGITGITQALIEDTRMNADVCGIVHAVVDQIDTTTLYNQVQSDLVNFKSGSEADFAQWSEERKVAFDAWFEDINAKLGEEPATALQQQINNISPQLAYKYKAFFDVESWQEGSGEFTQTAELVAMDGGPAVTGNSVFLPGVACEKSTNAVTNETLQDNLTLFQLGYSVSGENQITAHLFEKPTSDMEVIWVMKEGANGD